MEPDNAALSPRDPIWLIVVLGAFQILILEGAAVTHRARREEGMLPAACFSLDCPPPPRFATSVSVNE